MSKSVYKNIIFIVLFVLFSPSFALLIYGHRGARGLMPENTLPAYKKALEIGVDFVDLDVNMTQDHVLVVTHDDGLNPDLTRDAAGHWIKKSKQIKSLTLHALQRYNVCQLKPGTSYALLFKKQKRYSFCYIPTASEVITQVLQSAKHPIGFQIEIKTNRTHPERTFSPKILAQAVVALIHAQHIAAITEVQSFDFRCLQEVKRLDPQIKTAYLIGHDDVARLPLEKYGFSMPHMVFALGGQLFEPEDRLLTKAAVMEAHQLGLGVVVWSWPEFSKREYDATMVRKFIRWGVDGIITDRPDLLKKLVVSLKK